MNHWLLKHVGESNFSYYFNAKDVGVFVELVTILSDKLILGSFYSET